MKLLELFLQHENRFEAEKVQYSCHKIKPFYYYGDVTIR